MLVTVSRTGANIALLSLTIMLFGGPANANSLQISSTHLFASASKSPANQTDVLTDRGSASLVSFPESTTYVAAWAFASFDAIGAGAYITQSGPTAPIRNVRVSASMTDKVTVSQFNADPYYLLYELAVGGTIAIYAESSATMGSGVSVGPASYSLSVACANSACSDRYELHVPGKPVESSESNPVGDQLDTHIRKEILVPVSALTYNGSGFELPVSAGISVDINMAVHYTSPNFYIGLVSADYGSTTRVGAFRMLDENFQVIDATFISESGYDYTKALPSETVPEPGTVGVVTMGLVFISFSAWRRSNRS